MSKCPSKQLVDVDILKFSKKGHGIGATTDETKRLVEVPFSVPGDHLRATLKRKKNGIYSSQMESMINPSPLRIEPRCIHFNVCGGCKWQQLPYQQQLKIKQGHVEELFQPLLNSDSKVFPIISCDPPWQYRNKMEFSFSNDAAGNEYLGLIIDGSKGKVLNLMECHLVNPWFIQVLKATRLWWHESSLKAFHPYSNKGSLRTLTLREGFSSQDKLVMLTVSGNPEYALDRKQIDSFSNSIRESIDPKNRLSIFLRIQQAIKGSETNFYEMLLHGPDHIREVLHIQTRSNEQVSQVAFDVSPSAFFQPNPRQAEKLYSLALQHLDIALDSVVYDLYCGTGTLGICAAKYAKTVVGIEISAEASLDARTNVAKNGLTNVAILTGAVKDIIKAIRQDKTFPLPDIVMVDPPRSGLDKETLIHLSELRPKKILYISCNPSTQVQNIKDLHQIGYKTKIVQPIDQFPQTIHIENIAVLEMGFEENR